MHVFKVKALAGSTCLMVMLSSSVLADQKIAKHLDLSNEKTTKYHNDNVVKRERSEGGVESPNKSKAPKPINLAKAQSVIGKDSRVQLNGFLSAGLSATNTADKVKYTIPGHGEITNEIGFAPNSLAGIQVTGNISPKLAAVLQLKATGEQANGQQPYHPTVDWAFIRFKINDDFQARIGRMRIPAFLYSQTQEVGVTYVPVILPPEVYRVLPFNDFNGVDITYQFHLGRSDWVLSLNPTFGENTSKFDLYLNDKNPASSPNLATFRENNLVGGALSISNQHITLRGSWLRTALSMELANNEPIKKKTATFYSVGTKLELSNVVASGEFVHRKVPDEVASLSGYYALMGYRIDKLLPFVTYARLRTTNDSNISSHGSENKQAQSSVTVGADYDFNSHLVGKLGVSYITPKDGTKGLFTPNLKKEHVVMYTGQVDVVF